MIKGTKVFTTHTVFLLSLFELQSEDGVARCWACVTNSFTSSMTGLLETVGILTNFFRAFWRSSCAATLRERGKERQRLDESARRQLWHFYYSSWSLLAIFAPLHVEMAQQ